VANNELAGVYPENRMNYVLSLEELATVLQFLKGTSETIVTLEIVRSLEDSADITY